VDWQKQMVRVVEQGGESKPLVVVAGLLINRTDFHRPRYSIRKGLAIGQYYDMGPIAKTENRLRPREAPPDPAKPPAPQSPHFAPPDQHGTALRPPW
jgi:hypothetical protein